MRGLLDTHNEMEEELRVRVEVVVAELVAEADVYNGEAIVSDCWRVGRYAPERPRPVIIRFQRMCDKIAVLRGKGLLYGDGLSPMLQEWVEESGAPLRVYHDLSASQLDWKRRL